MSIDLLLVNPLFLHEDPVESQLMTPYFPLGILYVYSLNALGLGNFADRFINESLAMPIIGLASLVYWTSAIRDRSEFHPAR